MKSGHLVLTRKPGQRVRLRVAHPEGGHTDVWVMLIEMDRNRVRLGFRAPQSVVVVREELIKDT